MGADEGPDRGMLSTAAYFPAAHSICDRAQLWAHAAVESLSRGGPALKLA
jgi:hypothetical protein